MEHHSQGDYIITLDRSLMHVPDIHHWLSTESYWAKGIPFDVVQRAFDHSFVAGVIMNGRQIGFARLITDYAVFAYLADVYVENGHRGRGLSKSMIALMMEQPWVKSLRRIALATKDAHGLYEQYGFAPLQHPDRMMEILRPGLINNTIAQTHEIS
jgi:GNAT superfamily N-acetyltransferase